MRDDSEDSSTSEDRDLRGESMPARTKDIGAVLAETSVRVARPVWIEQFMVGSNLGPSEVTETQASK